MSQGKSNCRDQPQRPMVPGYPSLCCSHTQAFQIHSHPRAFALAVSSAWCTLSLHPQASLISAGLLSDIASSFRPSLVSLFKFQPPGPRKSLVSSPRHATRRTFAYFVSRFPTRTVTVSFCPCHVLSTQDTAGTQHRFTGPACQ